MSDSQNRKPRKCPSNKFICCKSANNFNGQRPIRAIPHAESVPTASSPALANGFGYRFAPGPIITYDPITEIPFKSTGPLNNVTATQNGLSVQAGTYEINVQLTFDYNTSGIVGFFAIAINGVPLDTTTFIATSVMPSSGTVTIQSLNSNDIITLIALNPPPTLNVLFGNLTIIKLN